MFRAFGITKSRRKEVAHPFPVQFRKEELIVVPEKETSLVKKFVGEY